MAFPALVWPFRVFGVAFPALVLAFRVCRMAFPALVWTFRAFGLSFRTFGNSSYGFGSANQLRGNAMIGGVRWLPTAWFLSQPRRHRCPENEAGEPLRVRPRRDDWLRVYSRVPAAFSCASSKAGGNARQQDWNSTSSGSSQHAPKPAITSSAPESTSAAGSGRSRCC